MTYVFNPLTGNLETTIIPDGSINTVDLADSSVTTAKISSGAVTTSKLASSIAPVVTSLNGGQLAGTRNRIINGGMAIDQRNNGSTQTFTAGGALAYCIDRWYAYSIGANATGVQSFTAQDGLYRYTLTGAAGITGMGFGQRIEQFNCVDLAGTTVTLSADIANNFLSTITWTLFKANSIDSFGTLAAPTRTQIATGNFTVTNILTRYSTQISIPSDANTGLEIVFTVGAQTSGSLLIGNVQLEPGIISTPFERRLYSQELILCQRYYYKNPTTGNGIGFGFLTTQTSPFRQFVFCFKTSMRAIPTVSGTCSVGTFQAQNINRDSVEVFADVNDTTTPSQLNSIIASAEL